MNRPLAYQKQNNSHDAQRQAQIVKILPLAERISRSMMMKLPAHIEFEEIYQIASEACIQAVDRFSLSGGASIETFASTRIRGAITDWLRAADRLPKEKRSVFKKAEEAIRRQRHQLGREPSTKEIAAALDLSVEEWTKMQSDAYDSHFLSLDDLYAGDDDADFLGSHQQAPASKVLAPPDQQLERQQLVLLLAQYIEKLPQKESLVVSLHYVDDMNFKEISAILEISEARVSQIHSQALLRLKTFFPVQA